MVILLEHMLFQLGMAESTGEMLSPVITANT